MHFAQQEATCMSTSGCRNQKPPASLNKGEDGTWLKEGGHHRIQGQRVHLRLIGNLRNSRALRNPSWPFHLSGTTGFPAYLLMHFARGPTHLQLRCPPLTDSMSPRGEPSWPHSQSCQPGHWWIYLEKPLARCLILVQCSNAWNWKVGSLSQLWKNPQDREQLASLIT